MTRLLAYLLLLVLAAHPSRTAAKRRWARLSVPPSQLITSPSSCLTVLECPPDRFCKAPPQAGAFSFFAPAGSAEISTCAPRLPEGANCTNVGVSECAQGTFCGFLDDFNPTPLRCLRQGAQGAACALSATSPCQGDLVCEFEPTCRPFDFGFEGDTCQFDRHCQQERGFFCRANFNQCAPKKPPGGTCEIEPNNFECDGFCVSSSDPFVTPGVCQSLQKAGESCNDDRQCQTLPRFFGRSRSADLLCNRPSGPVGVCVLETDLIRDLGAPCNPNNDTCDARRGLSCGRVRRKFKCVQRGKASDQFLDFCTPGSRLSSCPPDSRGNLRECRRALNASKQFTGVFGCRTIRQVVPLGNPCSNREFAVCARGTVCAVAPGVEQPSGRFPPPPLRTCMKVVPVGASCPDQFRFKCEEGSSCVQGICQRVDTPPTVPVTFASINSDCSELSCPPGTVCASDPEFPQSSKTCRLPVLEVKLWLPCFDSAQFDLRCKDNLQCSRNYLDESVRVCRPKRGIGGICENDDSCVGDLECDPSFRQEPFQRRCFDPALSLNIGDACNPYPRVEDPRCVAVVEAGPFSNVIPLSCLPKNGSNVCQRPAGLFQQCSAEENIACESKDLVCSELNVCIPKSQV